MKRSRTAARDNRDHGIKHVQYVEFTNVCGYKGLDHVAKKMTSLGEWRKTKLNGTVYIGQMRSIYLTLLLKQKQV